MRDDRETDQDIRRLLQAAGPRRQPDPALRERVQGNVLAAWQALPDQPDTPADPKQPAANRSLSHHRWQWPLALAASVLLAAVGVLWLRTTTAPAPMAGEIVRADGAYQIDGVTSSTSGIRAGSIVITGPDSGLLIRLSATASVQLAADTRAAFHPNARIQLLEGRVYLDSNGGKPGSIVIRTPDGDIRNWGTLFEVRVSAEETSIAVREGAVQLTLAGGPVAVRAAAGYGERIQVRQGQIVARGRLDTRSDYWRWTEALRSPFPLDGARVYDYLRWLARETGRVLVFKRPIAEQQAKLEIFTSRGTATVADAELWLEATNLRIVDGPPHQLSVALR